MIEDVDNNRCQVIKQVDKLHVRRQNHSLGAIIIGGHEMLMHNLEDGLLVAACTCEKRKIKEIIK
jgi:hypothetical protein